MEHIKFNIGVDSDEIVAGYDPMTIADAMKVSRYHGCRVRLMTAKFDHVGAIVNGRVYRDVADSELTTRPCIFGGVEALTIA